MTTLADLNIGFIGGGNMAQAMIGGLSNVMNAGQIYVSDPVDAVRTKLQQLGVNTVTDNNKLINQVDVVVLAIKPQLFAQVLSELSGKFTNQLVISIAAGLPISYIADLVSHKNIIRVMPNTPALVKQGASGMYAPSYITQADKEIAQTIMQSTGMAIWVNDEEKIHAVTAVSGSAPAYFFYVMESMIQAGVQMGLTQEQAKNLTLQTALGSATMALNSEDEPAVLRQKVTSPNGTTQAAIENMQTNEVGAKIIEAMQACANRSEELVKEFG